MNNKPVAWMQVHYKDKTCVTKLSPVQTWEDDIPLYTHPADLTDEEIMAIYWNMEISFGKPEGVVAFAKAILRKAQEK